ncbi:very-long-chain enoyl-CoA reductase isoform X5 [Haliaeetus albicilla]|uniref:very-long-chain enoyl-CoA reductase isoform X5 n=1 Tax=Haliaeetus albicilla TaxID=8969 RepID=UPI0037E800D0
MSQLLQRGKALLSWTTCRIRYSTPQVEILDWKTKKQLCYLDKVEPNATIREIRLMFHKLYPRWYPARQSIKLDPKGKSLRDEEILQHLPVGTTATLYFKDLGPQIGWTTVFLIEYTGPLFIYFLFYFRMPFVYGLDERFTSSPHPVVNLACICHSFHYIKRLIETVFVHRFSHGTMPLRNIVKEHSLMLAVWLWHRAAVETQTLFPGCLRKLLVLLGICSLACLLHQSSSLHSSFCVKLEIFPFMLHSVTSGEMDPKPVRSHIQQRILSHGCFSLYLALTIHMRWGPGSVSLS